MKNSSDLVGRRFGMLKVTKKAGIKEIPSGRKYSIWECDCDCGKTAVRTRPALVTGSSISCGCRKAIPNKGHFKTTHGATIGRIRSREYMIWDTIKSRCTNPKAHAYERYGGSGIEMCDRWRASFENFLEDVGKAPSSRHTIDRIDSAKGYFKENVRWATYTEQNRNRSNTVMVEFNGVPVVLSELCERFNVPNKVAYMRIVKYGWSVERALNTPVRPHK